MITQAELKERFDYREDGNLIRRYAVPGNGNFAGSVVGFRPKRLDNRNNRYVTTTIAGKHYTLHRLIYLYHHGVMPDQLDHINGNSLDNRIENLRPCVTFENTCNRARFKNNTSGYKGVSWNARNKRWFAYVDVRKNRTNIGYFDTVEEAAQAAAQVRTKLHGDFVRHA